MRIKLLNQQWRHSIQVPRLIKLAAWLGTRIELDGPLWREVVLVLVDNEGIAKTHREYFGKHFPTDVISFRYDPVPGEGEGFSGDLVVNVQRAVEEGFTRGDIDFELSFYIAHGFDHLSGSEDDTPANRQRMLTREKRWLSEAAGKGLLDRLIG